MRLQIPYFFRIDSQGVKRNGLFFLINKHNSWMFFRPSHNWKLHDQQRMQSRERTDTWSSPTMGTAWYHTRQKNCWRDCFFGTKKLQQSHEDEVGSLQRNPHAADHHMILRCNSAHQQCSRRLPRHVQWSCSTFVTTLQHASMKLRSIRRFVDVLERFQKGGEFECSICVSAH